MKDPSELRLDDQTLDLITREIATNMVTNLN